MAKGIFAEVMYLFGLKIFCRLTPMDLFEQRVFSMKLSQDKDFEDNTIYSIIQNFIPSLPQEAAGLLLEEVGGSLRLILHA